MKSILLLSFALLTSLTVVAQDVVINEFDSDTQGTDTKEFIELRTLNAETSLDGYVLVFFNGSTSGDDRSYFTLDLTGTTTDVNGLLLIGSNNVSPIPNVFVPANFIQNGTDAVAIYQASPNDFPDQTKATTVNLVDALIYQTGSGDANDTELQMLLGLDTQIDEDANNNKDFDSISRDSYENATYTVGTPTPGDLNDGGGFDFNGISFSTDQEIYEEGETVTITFTTEFAVSEDTTLNFSLNNGSFNTSDFSGPTSFTFLNGTSSAQVQILLLDDGVNDGDEFAEIDLGAIPEGFNRLLDNVEVQVNDVNFVVSNWGPPTMPTRGNVAPTTPDGYYDTLDGLAGETLRQAMQDIIAEEGVVRAQTYTDIIDILKAADQNPLNSNEVWLLYTEQARKKILFQDQGGSNVGLWNREHTYPRSRGDFEELEDFDEFGDGIDTFRITNADSLRHAYSDGHGLRAADGPENSSRGNQDYGEYSGPNGVPGSWRGDVARAVMFLAVRYNDLSLVAGNPTDTNGNPLGDLNVLLQWHREDQPDDFEMNRNNVVFEWQRNRNPFIDDPILVEHIFGNMQAVPYDPTLSVEDSTIYNIVLYPNPSHGTFRVSGITEASEVKIYNTIGQLITIETITQNGEVNVNLSSGLYIAIIQTETATIAKRLVLE